MDYAKEIEKYPDIAPADRAELEKLSVMQKDIAVGESAEDFVRHPFFKFFENKINDMIADTKGEVAALLKKPGVTIGEVQGVQNSIDKIVELKKWINGHIIKGRVGKQAIEMYEKDTDTMNEKIQAAVDNANK